MAVPVPCRRALRPTSVLSPPGQVLMVLTTLFNLLQIRLKLVAEYSSCIITVTCFSAHYVQVLWTPISGLLCKRLNPFSRHCYPYPPRQNYLQALLHWRWAVTLGIWVPCPGSGSSSWTDRSLRHCQVPSVRTTSLYHCRTVLIWGCNIQDWLPQVQHIKTETHVSQVIKVHKQAYSKASKLKPESRKFQKTSNCQKFDNEASPCTINIRYSARKDVKNEERRVCESSR